MKYTGREIELPEGRLVWLGEAEDKSGVHLRLRSAEGSHSQISLSHEAMRAIIDLYHTRDAKLRAYTAAWALVGTEMADGDKDHVQHKDDSLDSVKGVKWTAEVSKVEPGKDAP